MNKGMKKAHSVEAYIQGFPASTRKLLEQMRRTIRKEAPGASEKISYGIPTFFLNGNLVHFAGYEKHIGFYPGGAAIDTFKKEISGFESSRGTIRFPLDQPLPVQLIAKIVRARTARQTADFVQEPFAKLAAPARRALKAAGITSAAKLSKFTESEVAGLHGIGPNALISLRNLLRSEGLRFKKN